MKRLKDGGLAFYPTRWLHLVSGVLFTALFALFIYQMPPDQPFTYFIVAFWALAAFSFLKQGICPHPVCVVYPGLDGPGLVQPQTIQFILGRSGSFLFKGRMGPPGQKLRTR